MPKDLICFTHPGKMGDALYSLPTARRLSESFKMPADFCTSEYCRPMLRLVEYQSFIHKAYVHPAYEIERMDIGVQPWQMPVDGGGYYYYVCHMGFRNVPNAPLPIFIALQSGVDPTLLEPVQYDYPEFDTLDEDYIVIAPRGKTTFEPLYLEIIRKSPMKVVQIGGLGDAVGNVKDEKTVDITGLDMLETVTWIAKSKGFVGLMSAMLVLANGFDIPKVSPHDGKSWDMRHVIESPANFYPVLPTAEQTLGLLGL